MTLDIQFQRTVTRSRMTSKTINSRIPLDGLCPEPHLVSHIPEDHYQDIENADKVLKTVDRYPDIQELTPENFYELVEHVVIHKRAERWKKKLHQQIRIYFSYIGSLS